MFMNWLKRLKLTIPFLKALYQYYDECSNTRNACHLQMYLNVFKEIPFFVKELWQELFSVTIFVPYTLVQFL